MVFLWTLLVGLVSAKGWETYNWEAKIWQCGDKWWFPVYCGLPIRIFFILHWFSLYVHLRPKRRRLCDDERSAGITSQCRTVFWTRETRRETRRETGHVEQMRIELFWSFKIVENKKLSFSIERPEVCTLKRNYLADWSTELLSHFRMAESERRRCADGLVGAELPGWSSW